MNLKQRIAKCKAVIFDSDGVLVQEGEPIPGASRLINHLKEEGKRCVVLSNNSTRHPSTMIASYQDSGLDIDLVVNSGMLAVQYCLNEDINSVYVVGERGLVELLQENGIEVSAEASDSVIVGMDRTLTYEKLAIATRLLRKDRRFIATNPDKSFPTTRGLEPGAGSMIAALVASSDREPEIILGKPSTFGFDYILDEMSLLSEEVVMLGDRYETDIIGAVESEIFAIVVNTGVASTRDHPNRWENYPQVPLIQNLEDLIME